MVNLKKQSQKPAFGRKSVILSPKYETDRMEVKRQIPAHFKECYLKKQSQFGGVENERKVNYNNELRRKTTVWARKKQSQFKANRWPLAGNPKQYEECGMAGLKAQFTEHHLKKQSQTKPISVSCKLISILSAQFRNFS